MICGRCGRKLKDPESIKLGYGPVCRAEMGIKKEGKRSTKPKVGTSSSSDNKRELEIPGQMSVFDMPEWLPEDMKGEEHEQD